MTSRPTSVTDGVKFAGKIVDADTGKPIANAVFVVLKQGINWDAYDNSDEQILEAVQTDRKGQFEMSEMVERAPDLQRGLGRQGLSGDEGRRRRDQDRLARYRASDAEITEAVVNYDPSCRNHN